jgi:hypothetical protein
VPAGVLLGLRSRLRARCLPKLARSSYGVLLPPIARVELALALSVLLGASGISRSLCFGSAGLAILGRWSGHTILGGLAVAPATGKCDWSWCAWHFSLLSMRDGNLSENGVAVNIWVRRQ